MKFNNDTIVQPIATEWFQFYVPNQDKQIQAFSESNAAVSWWFKSHNKERGGRERANSIKYALILDLLSEKLGPKRLGVIE